MTAGLHVVERGVVRDLDDGTDLWRAFLTQLPTAWAFHEIVCDDSGKPIDYVFLAVNDAFQRMTGLDPKSLLGRKVTEVIPGIRDATPDLIEIYGRVALEGEPKVFEIFFAPLDRWYAITASCPKRGYFTCYFDDITARRRDESDVHLFFNVTLDLLCIAGFDGHFKKLSPTWSRVLGWTNEELQAKPFLDFVHPEDKESTLAAAGRLADGRNVVGFTNRYLCKDGSYRWISWNSFALVERQLIMAAARDITDERRTQDEIRGYRDHLEELVTERTAELRRSQETVTVQARELLELSTPVMQVWDGVLVAPLIGTLDSQRTSQFMERLLKAIVDTRSEIALVDITGVPVIDTQTAHSLIETTVAVKLLGARVVLTGVRPAIAQTLVHLGVDMSGIITRASLSAGLRWAWDALGVTVSRQPERG